MPVDATTLLSLIPPATSNHERVVIIENSNGLSSDGGSEAFRCFLIENKIRHNVIYNVSELTHQQMISLVKSCLDTLVVFETTGVTQSFKDLVYLFIHYTHRGYRFKFLQCEITNNFQYYRLPQEVGPGCISYHNLVCHKEDPLEKWVLREVKRQ